MNFTKFVLTLVQLRSSKSVINCLLIKNIFPLWSIIIKSSLNCSIKNFIERIGFQVLYIYTKNTIFLIDEIWNNLTHFHVTENNQSLFAFSDETERELFLMLIGVSGIGPKTAIILLSSVTPDEFK